MHHTIVIKRHRELSQLSVTANLVSDFIA